MIFKIFSPKNLAEILALFAQTTASFCKNVIITLVCEKNVLSLSHSGSSSGRPFKKKNYKIFIFIYLIIWINDFVSLFSTHKQCILSHLYTAALLCFPKKPYTLVRL
jgi:hypothetical protein